MHPTAAFDVIGDVHGYADKLERLLSEMGYAKHEGVWSHPHRSAVFIGDLIDRGAQQLATVEIVRAMVAGGSARIVMGNHEFNAIAWATRHPDRPDEYLRPRHGTLGEKNRHQHAGFLDAVGDDSPLHLELIEWFKTFPLWLDLGSARFVHACWSPAAIAMLAPRVGPDNTLTDDLLVSSSTKHDPDYEAVETLLKGPEIDLPPGFAYLDKDGIHRERARYAWWNPDATTYRTAAIIPDNARAADGTAFTELPDEPLAVLPSARYDDDTPLFVGHYWQTGTPTLLHDRVACVDYSAGKGGPLVAYRFNGEAALSASSFVSVD